MIQGKYRFPVNVFRKVGFFRECSKERRALSWCFRESKGIVWMIQGKYRFFVNFSRTVRLFLNVSQEEGVFGE